MLTRAFTNAWDVFRQDLVAWCIFSAVVILAGAFIPFFGALLLLPNMLRESKAALREERSPDVAAIFDFSHFKDDLATTGLYAIAQLVGVLMCCVGWPVAWILFWYSVEICADERVSPMDAMRLSMAYAMKHPGDTIGMALAGVLLNSLGASIAFGIFFTTPLVFLAWTFYWLDVREEVYALAERKGISVTPETLPGA